MRPVLVCAALAALLAADAAAQIRPVQPPRTLPGAAKLTPEALMTPEQRIDRLRAATTVLEEEMDLRDAGQRGNEGRAAIARRNIDTDVAALSAWLMEQGIAQMEADARRQEQAAEEAEALAEEARDPVEAAGEAMAAAMEAVERYVEQRQRIMDQVMRSGS